MVLRLSRPMARRPSHQAMPHPFRLMEVPARLRLDLQVFIQVRKNILLPLIPG